MNMQRFIPAFAGNTCDGWRGTGTGTVHPRVCGEHKRRQVQNMASYGSSPRLRGTHYRPHHRAYFPRFIPAFAGNTFLALKGYSASPVHPRVCGEHGPELDNDSGPYGSSPRLRGTLGGIVGGQGDGRFIPAFAGNTCAPTTRRSRETVHPRVCGEHSACQSSFPSSCGSSPRLRGTLVVVCSLGIIARFIPAFAGNTTLWSSSSFSCLVHPRVCGEHRHEAIVPGRGVGSSPRLRGTPARAARVGWPERFIPAFAGNTGERLMKKLLITVHPRVCGEHTWSGGLSNWAFGSSPRLRGTHGPRGRADAGDRFIPAFAGNTGLYTGRVPAASVHPRVCGEHGLGAVAVDQTGGSSPRLRGTLPLRRHACQSSRFIHAFAGNTNAFAQTIALTSVHPRVCGEHLN